MTDLADFARRWPLRSTAQSLCALLACSGCLAWPPPREQLDTSPIASAASAPIRVTVHPEADEDPAVVLARDGRFLLVWSGKRSDGVHLRLRTSRDGATWGPESRVTGGAEEDFYPSLVQARDGAFHLVWFRLEREAGRTEIWHARSPDGLAFADPRRITNDPAQDWAPTIHEDADRVLWIVWSSGRSGNRELYAVRSTDGGIRWSPPDPLTRTPEEDDFPHLVEGQDGERTLVWTRFRAGARLLDYWRDTTSEIVVATSGDGRRFATPVVCSPPDVERRYTEILPWAFVGPGGRVLLSWTSDRSDRHGDILLGELSKPDAPLRQLTTSEGADYDGKVVATRERGEYLLVWVSSEAGNPDIFARRFRP